MIDFWEGFLTSVGLFVAASVIVAILATRASMCTEQYDGADEEEE